MPTFLCLEPVPARTAVTSSQIDTHKMNLVYTTELLWRGIGYIFHQEKGYTERCVFYHIDVILGATSETTQNPFYFPAKALYFFQLRDGKWKQRNVKNRTEDRYCQRNNNRSTDQANQSLTALLNLNTIIEQSWGKILKRTKYLQKYTHTHKCWCFIMHIISTKREEENIIPTTCSLCKSPLLSFLSCSTGQNLLWKTCSYKPIHSDWNRGTCQSKWSICRNRVNSGFAELTFYWPCLLPILTYFQTYIK